MRFKPGPGLRKRLRRRPGRTVYVGSYEDKLSRIPAVHLSADEEKRHTPAETAVDRMLRLGGVPRESRFK